ncbi:MAG: hypothetical protein AB1758_14975, partial [Candidatus Eremiobacterota bacterium]
MTLQTDSVLDDARQALPELGRLVDRQLRNTLSELVTDPSLDTLRYLENDWGGLSAQLDAIRKALTSRAAELEEQIDELDDVGLLWQRTLATEPDLPEELRELLQAFLSEVEVVRQLALEHRVTVLSLLNRVSEQAARIQDAMADLARAREEKVGRM